MFTITLAKNSTNIIYVCVFFIYMRLKDKHKRVGNIIESVFIVVCTNYNLVMGILFFYQQEIINKYRLLKG